MTNRFDYEIFARVIKVRSLSAAAREPHSSPAMISKRLTRLEERLGVTLLPRTTRRLTPAQVGQSFFERVLAVLAANARRPEPYGDREIHPLLAREVSESQGRGGRPSSPTNGALEEPHSP
jgi:DNA-binding transcriptional LysR family regulator